PPDRLPVQRVAAKVVHRHHDRLVHLVRDDPAHLRQAAPWPRLARCLTCLHGPVCPSFPAEHGAALRLRPRFLHLGGNASLSLNGLDPRDIPLDLPDTRGVRQLADCLIKAQIAPLGAQLIEFLHQLRVAHRTDFVRLHAWPPPVPLSDPAATTSRRTTRHFIGILWMARRSASSASSSRTPPSSNMTRPGFTTATQYSGLPLPLPMRVSAGFCVTGLSGKIRIQTFPPRRT